MSVSVYKRGQFPTGPTLTQAEVDGLVKVAASNIADNSVAIAVIDRAGRILAVYKRPGAGNAEIERALAIARSGAFFSNNRAPLSSRTIRVLGGVHFPAGVRDTLGWQLLLVAFGLGAGGGVLGTWFWSLLHDRQVRRRASLRTA